MKEFTVDVREGGLKEVQEKVVKEGHSLAGGTQDLGGDHVVGFLIFLHHYDPLGVLYIWSGRDGMLADGVKQPPAMTVAEVLAL